MANHISMKRLGDIVNFKRGYDLPSYNRKDGNYPIVSSSGISGYHAEYKVDGEGIVIGRYGTLGEVYYVNGKYWPHNTALYVTDFKGNYPKYVYYLLKVLGNLQTSDKSTVPGINRNDLHEVIIPCADSKDQQKIAAVLSALDAKIELNQRINAELESMAKTLYDYWFVQFEFPTPPPPPAIAGTSPKSDIKALDNNKNILSDLGEAGRGYKSAGGKMVWNEELKREIPLGWEICELRKYVSANRGLSYSGKHITGGGVPMINLNSFNMADGSYKPEGIKTYSGDYGEHKILKPFDLVMCNTQQTALDPKKDIIGKSFLVPDIFETDIVSSHHVTTVTVEKENLKYYLNSLFNTEYFHRYISGYATGTNILGLNFEGVLSFKTAIPNDDLLERYKAIVVNVEKQKARIIKESQTLTELRDWLLPMLMNGQITVS